MTQALHTTFIDPDQARKAIMNQISPYCKVQWMAEQAETPAELIEAALLKAHKLRPPRTL